MLTPQYELQTKQGNHGQWSTHSLNPSPMPLMLLYAEQTRKGNRARIILVIHDSGPVQSTHPSSIDRMAMVAGKE